MRRSACEVSGDRCGRPAFGNSGNRRTASSTAIRTDRPPADDTYGRPHDTSAPVGTSAQQAASSGDMHECETAAGDVVEVTANAAEVTHRLGRAFNPTPSLSRHQSRACAGVGWTGRDDRCGVLSCRPGEDGVAVPASDVAARPGRPLSTLFFETRPSQAIASAALPACPLSATIAVGCQGRPRIRAACWKCRSVSVHDAGPLRLPASETLLWARMTGWSSVDCRRSPLTDRQPIGIRHSPFCRGPSSGPRQKGSSTLLHGPNSGASSRFGARGQAIQSTASRIRGRRRPADMDATMVFVTKPGPVATRHPKIMRRPLRRTPGPFRIGGLETRFHQMCRHSRAAEAESGRD